MRLRFWKRREKRQIRVLELSAAKLEAGARYLFVVNRNVVTLDKVDFIRGELTGLGVGDIAVLPVHGPPEEAIQVFEVV